MRPRIKVCCIQDEDEARRAVAAGADALGFVGRGLSGPEVIPDDDRIAALAATVPPWVSTVLLTRLSDPDALAAQVVRCRTSTVQICDAVPPEAWAAVRRAAPGVRVLQVVHVTDEGALRTAREAAPHVDALLLDSGSPAGPTPAYGGTGRTHDWDLSARIVALARVPVILAGGLHAGNVAHAWATVRPYGLDLCSGVRRGGRLDDDRLRAFFDAVAPLT